VKTRVLAAGLALGVSVGHPTRAAGEGATRAGAFLAAGKVHEAAEAARSCAEPACALVLARALFGMGRTVEAAAAAHAARFGPLEAHAARLEGEALLLAGRPREALEPLRDAIGRDPDGPPGLRSSALLADALLAGGDFAEARRQADHAGSLPGQPPEVRAAMAWDAAQAMAASPPDAKLAAEAMRNFWLQHPDHPAAEEARAVERELAQLPPPTGRALLARASRLLAAGQPAAAVAQAEAAVDQLRGEDRGEAQLLHARALAADGRRTDAGPALEEAWSRGGPHIAAQAGMLLARDRARRGRDPEAIRIALQVARKFPLAPEAEESVLFVARLDIDAGRRGKARARLAPLAAKRTSANASAARWQLAWMSRQDGLRDAVERFAGFAASAATDAERAQGLYWQARSEKADDAPALFRRAADLDVLGWYGLLARAQLGQTSSGAAPFPPRREPVESALPARLALAMELVSLGLLAEAASEADWFVHRHAGDASAIALPVYERAGKYDRSVTLAEGLLGGRGALAPRALLAAAYPAAFPAEVESSARRVGIDPYLLLSIMRRESLFKPDTRSVAGAVGLLQLLPATARRSAMVMGRPPLRDEQLVIPATAIDLGAWYLSELVGRFGNPCTALAAYNAGPRVAAPWAMHGAGKQVDEWVEDIPYRETRRYVKTVVGAWSAYRILAGGPPPQLSDVVPAPKMGANF
jgi:soluble lytic murein transglycosylase